ncbi:MAG: fumarylacetoacetate hydrolase family protein [Bdellovibrionia bacterium]
MIRNIWAIGRNYADHAKELGNSVPSTPMVFLKAGSTAVFSSEIQLPSWAQDVHHEVELALIFNEALEVERACLALDLTERKKQTEAKNAGSPWTLAKSFTSSCPLSAPFEVSHLDELSALALELKINGEVKQAGNTQDMIFKIPTLIDYVKSHFPVCAGDLLLTGTPSGVGPIQRGDFIEAQIFGKTSHRWIVK